MTDQAPEFPTGPYRLLNTKSGHSVGGPRISSPWSALTALRRYMRNAPQSDPVVLDAADRPVSANTLFAVSIESGRAPKRAA